MKIIIFGGSGFLGSHVADVLTQQGHDVVIFDKDPSPYLKDNQELIVSDVLDMQSVCNAVQGADVVYNFTAIADLEEADQNPIDTVKINVLGNMNILEAARQANVKRFIFSSSIYVYSDAGSFYRSSKQASELFIENYSQKYDMPYTILRYGSLYGPRADENNSIYKMLEEALVNNKITRHGDGEEIREYIHVLDAAHLSVKILGKEYENQCMIITGNEQIKIKDLLTMIKEMLKNKVDIEYLPAKNSMHYEVTPYTFSPKIAKKLHPSESLDMGQGILNLMTQIYQKHHLQPKG